MRRPGASGIASVSAMRHRRGTTREVVHTELRRRILTLTTPPGAPISENDIAADLGVSRTPVREALILLGDEGLVEVYPQVGTFASLVDIERVRDAQFLRESVEVASLASLAGDGDDGGGSGAGLDPEVLARLRENIAAQREALEDSERFFDLDEAFHRDLMTLAGHGGVWPSVVSAKGHLDRARRLGMAEIRPASQNLEQHAAILDAAADGRGEEAVALLRGHLRSVLEDVVRIRELHPELFARPGSHRVRG
ncbi:DNA-binding GntR family transcriptional regulator [Salana multivorans]|uniref:DNA-binding GntR family transcriptional regulator n=2 Tax=Salana multivorans TaxID=120377 RepID=A0A3N2DC22_9MICO|nr:DNA-binding GntR family transcriptional regulator [Salana multivorans]